MDPDQPRAHECDKTCPRDCEILNRILLREARVEQFYIQLLESCDYPDVRRFTRELLERRRKRITALERSLNRMYSSFDPSGC